MLETEYEEIFKAICSRKLTAEEIETKITELFDLLMKDNKESVRSFLKTLVPTYTYQEKLNGYGKLKSIGDTFNVL